MPRTVMATTKLIEKKINHSCKKNKKRILAHLNHCSVIALSFKRVLGMYGRGNYGKHDIKLHFRCVRTIWQTIIAFNAGQLFQDQFVLP